MGKMKEQLLEQEQAVEVFGDYRKKFIIATDEPSLQEGDTVTLVNKNCEFEFDNVAGVFENNLYYYFIVDLKLVEADYSNYEVSKSNNGGAYAYATFKVVKVHEKSY